MQFNNLNQEHELRHGSEYKKNAKLLSVFL